jgi:hypothetical protein
MCQFTILVDLGDVLLVNNDRSSLFLNRSGARDLTITEDVEKVLRISGHIYKRACLRWMPRSKGMDGYIAKTQREDSNTTRLIPNFIKKKNYEFDLVLVFRPSEQ